ncbi:DUF1659 domain-containing protein [Peptoniphilus sp. KCTC 25270]|uniref:DUF1659 domain-containing protein n=1 Tax=Peptoniphilus sp. KCTC 25270 TaxID=2897414 RepID=UPI001E45560D|nr:DUF1659 domain-containing protein [Peptoniphilus sp. KCTC 25270]MCD1147765.1 DUF1659 domain-containing protein [Peptoniphilus sp. KCTC 25270]
MAVQRTKTISRMTIYFDNGLTDSGKMRLKRKSFRDINPEATDEQIYDCAVQLASLYKKNPVEYGKEEDHTLKQG